MPLLIFHLDLDGNMKLTNTGIGSSLDMLTNPDIRINLSDTHVRSLDKIVFQNLISMIFNSKYGSSGNIDLSNIHLNCSCDVKWIIDGLSTSVIDNARCVVGKCLFLQDVNPLLLETWCPMDPAF